MQYLALDTPENREVLTKEFPNLDDSSGAAVFKITSPATTKYNCIAWAMGFDDRWIDYVPDMDVSKKKWWPKGVHQGFLPIDLIHAFEAVGFECCDDDIIEDGYDKVALYKVSPFYDQLTGRWEPVGWTHAARVIAPGVYHSKMGPQFDIHHSSGPVFHGSIYGDVYQLMKRRIQDREISEKIKQEEPRIFIPQDINNIIAEAISKGLITLV